MRLVGFLGILAFAMLAFVAIALGVPESPLGHGFTHPEIASMERGGEGYARAEAVLELGWAFGLAQVLFFTGLLALGARSRDGLRGLGPGLLAGGLVYAVIWTALVLTYRTYALSPDPVHFLGFPAPTAIMLFALYAAPGIFMVLYVVGFERWIASPADLAALERRLADLRRERDDS